MTFDFLRVANILQYHYRSKFYSKRSQGRPCYKNAKKSAFYADLRKFPLISVSIISVLTASRPGLPVIDLKASFAFYQTLDYKVITANCLFGYCFVPSWNLEMQHHIVKKKFQLLKKISESDFDPILTLLKFTLSSN